ncbi:MAG: polymer-forming cytoskeletal protein [Candidatus Rokubacteria bacterium]|nr:polymer-forming cytoskeletal protein [Candidatus Rokubacteria bacterium]MBI2878367.1 polymer-forming cytoskeletal protein [Candidatus Rokubacteria bacterium]
MALWKETQSRREAEPFARPVTAPESPFQSEPHDLRPVPGPHGESLLAAGMSIEGKIEGAGNVRIAGRFKGSVHVRGELTIEPGASINGEVKADSVLVGGEVQGNIVARSRVEFQESGSLVGDLKAGSLTVAAGSKMKAKVEFGWKEGEVAGEPESLGEGQGR